MHGVRDRLTVAFWVGWLVLFVGLVAYNALIGPLTEWFGPTPQSKVGDFVAAVARGDEGGAFAVWELPPLPKDDNPTYAERARQRNEALSQRRERVTGELIAAKPSAQVEITDIQWWNACCDPTVIEDPKGAGGGRVTASVRLADGGERRYVFDVWHRDGTYSGLFTGEPHHWALFDVYPEGDEPLYFRVVRLPSGVVRLP